MKTENQKYLTKEYIEQHIDKDYVDSFTLDEDKLTLNVKEKRYIFDYFKGIEMFLIAETDNGGYISGLPIEVKMIY